MMITNSTLMWSTTYTWLWTHHQPHKRQLDQWQDPVHVPLNEVNVCHVCKCDHFILKFGVWMITKVHNSYPKKKSTIPPRSGSCDLWDCTYFSYLGKTETWYQCGCPTTICHNSIVDSTISCMPLFFGGCGDWSRNSDAYS